MQYKKIGAFRKLVSKMAISKFMKKIFVLIFNSSFIAKYFPFSDFYCIFLYQ